MIFVTVGTTEFDDLIYAMDRIALTLDEPVVMQVGHGDARPAHAEWFAYAHSLDAYYREAKVVVSHGGLGTVVEVLKAGGRLVGVSNLQLHDRHQDDLLRAFEKEGYLIWCRSLAYLDEALASARMASFQPYHPPSCTLHQEIEELLSHPQNLSWWKRIMHHR